MDPVTVALAGLASGQKTMPDTVALFRQEMPRRLAPLVVVQAQFNRLGIGGKERKIHALFFNARAEPVWNPFCDHALQSNRI